jgi:hypothetical protein
MTVREYNLARQGHERNHNQDLRRNALWMSILLNSQYAEAPYTPALLLGEEEPEGPTEAEVIKEGERKLRQMQKKYPHLF